MVTPFVVAVRVTLNAVPAVFEPATARATLSVGGADVVADAALVADVQLVPSIDWIVYEYVVDPVSPVSLQVTVGAPTVQTVAVVGAVRFTMYWVGAGRSTARPR